MKKMLNFMFLGLGLLAGSGCFASEAAYQGDIKNMQASSQEAAAAEAINIVNVVNAFNALDDATQQQVKAQMKQIMGAYKNYSYRAPNKDNMLKGVDAIMKIAPTLGVEFAKVRAQLAATTRLKNPMAFTPHVELFLQFFNDKLVDWDKRVAEYVAEAVDKDAALLEAQHHIELDADEYDQAEIAETVPGPLFQEVRVG